MMRGRFVPWAAITARSVISRPLSENPHSRPKDGLERGTRGAGDNRRGFLVSSHRYVTSITDRGDKAIENSYPDVSEPARRLTHTHLQLRAGFFSKSSAARITFKGGSGAGESGSAACKAIRAEPTHRERRDKPGTVPATGIRVQIFVFVLALDHCEFSYLYVG